MKHLTSFILVVSLAVLSSGSMAQTSPVVDTILVGDTTNRERYLYLPWNFHYVEDYTQQLVLASELNGAALITGIDFYARTVSYVGRPCTVYLANTYVPRLHSIVPSGPMFQRMAVDTFNTTMGWHHIEFDTPFPYDGLGNLLVAVETPYSADNGWITSVYFSECASAGNSVSMHGMVYNHRNIMRLHTLPFPAPPASCPEPSLRVDAIGPTEVKLTHVLSAAGHPWSVACITDGDTAWRTAGYRTGDTSWTMTGLSPNTHYTFRLTSFCTDTFATTLKHIQTCCYPEVLPFSEDFEAMWSVDDCWYRLEGSTGNVPSPNDSRAFRGGYSLRLNSGTMVLPPLEAPVDSLELSCWVLNGTISAGFKLYVGIIVDHRDPSTFIPVDTIVLPNSWHPVVVRFDGHPGIVGRIAIKSDIDWMYIDDLEVRRISPCPTIREVSVGHVTDTNAVVYWVDSGAVSYEVACVPSGSAIDTSHIFVSSHADSLLLEGLDPYTLYDVYVRSFCNEAYSNWSPVISFRTDCSIKTLPFLEDFNSCAMIGISAQIPCWRGSLQTVYIASSSRGDSSSKEMQWNWTSDSYFTQGVVLPAIDTTNHPINTLQISFWAKNLEDMYNQRGDARVAIGIMSNPDNFSTFQPLDTVEIVGFNWRRYDVPLADYNGVGCYIAFKACSSTDSVRNNCWTAFFDDVMVDLIPPCPSVSELVLVGFSSSSATVRWNSQEDGTMWQIAIDTVASATPVPYTSASLTLPTYTFNNLEAETSYCIWVRSLCTKGDTSDWVGPLWVKPSDSWNMRANNCDTLSLCGQTIYDEDCAIFNLSRLILMPDTLGHRVIIGGRCDIGSNGLTIFDGVGISGNILWSKDVGVDLPAFTFGPIISDSGPLTIEFDAPFNYHENEEGFELHVNCAPDTCIVYDLCIDTTVAATNSSLALVWNSTRATSYEVVYGPVGFAPGTGTVATTDSNRFVITGLYGIDSLEVHVRSLCSANYWATGIFHIVGDTTGIDVHDTPKYDIVLYPNPFRGVVKVKMGNGRLMERDGAVTAILTDVTGRYEEVRLTTEAPGQYLLDMATTQMLKQSGSQTLLLTLTTDDGKKHTVRLLK